MQKCKVSFILSLLFLVNISAQNLEWVNTGGGTFSDEIRDFVIDKEGDVISIGYFQNTVDFDPSPNVINITSQGSYDIFINKYNSQGQLIWVKTLGSNQFQFCNSVNIDENNNIYVLGYMGPNDTVDFDPGPGINELTTTNDPVLFVLKLDDLGEFIALDKIETLPPTFGANIISLEHLFIDVNSKGGYCISGALSGSIDFDPDPISSDIYQTVGISNTDFFVARYDSTGHFLWGHGFPSAGPEIPHDIAFDTLDNIYLIGNFTNNIDFDPGNGTVNISSTGNEVNSFVLKLDHNGTYIWSQVLLGVDPNYYKAIYVKNEDEVYLAGNFQGTVDFDPGNMVQDHTASGFFNHFVQKLDQNGLLSWVKVFNGGTGTVNVNDILLDSEDNIFIVGEVEGGVDFDAGSNNYIHSSVNSQDGFIQKLSSNGDFIGVLTSNSNDFEIAKTVNFSSSGDLYYSGYYSDQIEFPVGSFSGMYLSNGEFDFYLAKFLKETLLIKDQNETFTIYPNPVENSISISIRSGEIHNLVIYNISGNVVLRQKLMKSITIIDINHLSQGVYILSLSTPERKVVNQMVKM